MFNHFMQVGDNVQLLDKKFNKNLNSSFVQGAQKLNPIFRFTIEFLFQGILLFSR